MISCSLGPNGPDWALTTILDLAIRFAAANGRSGLGIPIFWAASNGSYEIALDEVASHLDVLAIGRSNRNDLQDGSAFGPKLEFLAPGVDVQHQVRFQIWHRDGLQLRGASGRGCGGTGDCPEPIMASAIRSDSGFGIPATRSGESFTILTDTTMSTAMAG